MGVILESYPVLQLEEEKGKFWFALEERKIYQSVQSGTSCANNQSWVS